MPLNKNLVIIFVLLLLMIGAVWFLQPKPDPVSVKPFLDPQTVSQQSVMVYFSKSKGSEMVTEPVSRKLPEPKPETSKEMIRYAMAELLKGPTEKEQDLGFYSEIPGDTRLLSVKETNSRIDIDVSGEFASGGGSSSMVQRLQQIIKTVVSVRQKKPVYLKVDGKSLEVLGGEGVMVHEPITDDPSVAQ